MVVNGKYIKSKENKISDLLEELGLRKDRVVVEVNKEIVSADSYNKVFLNEEDNVEIISFVGGG